MVRACLLAIFLLGFSLGSQAQESEQFKNPHALFESAFELYQRDVFGPSLEKFTVFLSEFSEHANALDARFYQVLCKMQLGQNGVNLEALELVKTYPHHRLSQHIYFHLGNYYLARGKFKQASRYLNEVDETSLPVAERQGFTFNKAYALFKSKKYKKAAIAFQPLTLKENPYYLKSNYYYGYSLYQEKNYSGALKTFKKIENKGPQTMKLYMAQIYYLQGNYQEAISKSSEISKPHIKRKGLLVVGKSYYKLKDYKKALVNFEAAGVAPDSLTDMEQYEVGYSYYKNDQHSKAFTYLSPIANKGDELAQLASYTLGHSFLKLDKKQSALNAYFEAQRRDYSISVKEEALFLYAKLSYDVGNTKNATAAFGEFIKTFPNSNHSDEARSILASLFVNTSDYATALEMIAGIKNWDDQTKKLYQNISMRRGKELVNAHQYDKAKVSFVNSMKYPIDKVSYAECIFWKAEMAAREGENTEAFKLHKSFLNQPGAKECSMYPTAYYNLAYLHYEKEQYKQALDDFSEVTKLKTSYAINKHKLNDCYLRLGDCNYVLKNYSAALTAYSYTTSGDRPEADYAYFQKGMIYGLTNRSEEKLQVMKRIPQKYPMSIYVQDAIFEIGNEHFLHENYSEAERNFRYLLSDFPKSTYAKRALLSLGQIQYNEGKNEKALEVFKEVVTKYPSTSEAKNASSIIKRIYISNGMSEDYLAWLEGLPNSSVRASYKDSVTFDAAEKRLLKGDFTVSLSDFENYLTQYPRGYFVIKAHHYALFCAEKLENEDKEIVHLKKLAEAAPNEYSEASIYRLAEIYRDNNNCSEALVYWNMVEEGSRSLDNRKEAQYEKLICYEQQKDTLAMEGMATKLARYEVLSTEQKGKAYTVLAEKSYRNGALEKSKTLFREVRSEMQDEQGAKSMYFLAQIDYDQGKLDSSKAKILEYGEHFSYYEFWFGKCFILLSDIYMANEDAFQAKATLNSVIENFESKEIVDEAKAKLVSIEVQEAANDNGTNGDAGGDTIEDSGE